MRKYWVQYWRNFGNTYNLFYTENPEEESMLPGNAERITRKKALQLAREESDRRKFDGAFAYYASATIAPLSVEDIVNNSHYQLIGRIWEKAK